MAKKIGAIVLAFLGIYMLYLGAQMKAQPPFVTGIGFIIISLFHLSKK
jgi:drug/metabolite transporter (DMT)-like permease